VIDDAIRNSATKNTAYDSRYAAGRNTKALAAMPSKPSTTEFL
jgi:hypothetical protein